MLQSRITVTGETFSTSAISSTESPPKYRISTTRHLRGSNAASRFSASSSAANSSDFSSEMTAHAESDTLVAPAPRLSRRRERA